MPKTISKADLVDQMAKKLDFSKTKTADTIGSFIEIVSKEITKGNKVQLVGFGTFSAIKRAKKKGTNPATGKAITIPAKKIPKFSPGKALKDAVAKK